MHDFSEMPGNMRENIRKLAACDSSFTEEKMLHAGT
jgi:hypothetical protein